jgi:hypothetical protein
MTAGFGGAGYTSPQTRTLNAISETPVPDAQDLSDASKVAQLLQTHTYQLKELADGQKELQKGVNDATQNPIQQIQQFVADIIVLFGGGEITSGLLDFGDLQYILPTLGALFGLGDGPFPINLFEAAEKFFLGYVVPSQQFADEINTIIGNWMTTLGFDPKFIKDLKALITALGDLFGELGNLLPSLDQFFKALGLDGGDLGPLGQALAPIIKLFSGIDLAKFGSLIEFITSAIDPFIVELTALINFINAVLAVMGFQGEGGVVNSPLGDTTLPFSNLFGFLGDINFASPTFDPIAAAEQFITTILSPTGLLFGPNSPLNVANLFGFLPSSLFSSVPLGAITTEQPNVLAYGTFPPGSIMPGSEWDVDMSASRTADDGTGAGYVVGDGTFHALRTGRTPGEKIPANAGQTLTGWVFVRHAGYSGVGDPPFRLEVVPYTSDGTRLDPVELDSYAPQTADAAWPGHQMSGTYEIPVGVTQIQLRMLITDGALAGNIWIDDGGISFAAQLDQSSIAGLGNAFSTVEARFQLIVDSVTNVLTGGNSINNEIKDMVAALLAIPFSSVLGVGGPGDIGGSIEELLNQFVGGAVGQAGTGASFPDVFNLTKFMSSGASLGQLAFQILGIRNNTPVASGMLPSGSSNYDLTDLAFDNSAPYLSATQAASLISVERLQVSKPLGAISWLGYGFTNVTSFYVNLWRYNSTTSSWDRIYHSPNILGSLDASGTSANPKYQFCYPASPPAGQAGDLIARELVPVGSGTHFVKGKVLASWMPNHPVADVKTYGFTRDNTSNATSPPTSIPTASFTMNANVPWIETAVDNGTPGADNYPDVVIKLDASGTVPIPFWANYIDVIPVGPGGPGRAGTTLDFNGEGGQPGKVNPTTWHKGPDYDSTTGIVSFTLGEGTSATSFAIPGHTQSAVAGAPGVAVRFNGSVVGKGPGPITYNGEPFAGGGDQSVAGGAGIAPGGAGAGGRGIVFNAAGPGAPGGGLIRFRQNPIAGEVTSADVTPPSVPTGLDLVSATFSTLTVRGGGSVDA